MTAFESMDAGRRELVEVDALMRALRALRHWSAAAAARRNLRDDIGRRLYASAADLRDEAWADSLQAAYALFEIDAIHDSWIDAGVRRT